MEIVARNEEPRRRGRPPGTRERGKHVCDWIEKHCFVPEGTHVGKSVKLLPWQQEFIRAIYNNKQTTRRAILSLGRKNGKTTLVACLLLVHLCGPEAKKRPNSQIFSAAQSRDQAALVFNLAAKMVRLNPLLRDAVTIHESNKALSCPDLGTRYRALSAEATTAYGLSPAFVVHDELGLVRGPRSELFEALETATGAQAEPLSIIISTQAPTDADLLSVLIDDALAGHDPSVVCKVYTAPKDLDPFDPATIKLANPSLGAFLSVKEANKQANDAKRMPARENEFRNLILNQRVLIENPFVSPEIWKACSDVPEPFTPTTELYAGLDLSEVADLTALVLIGKINNRWHVHPTFWLPQEGLEHKSMGDRVPYDLWRDQGYLQTTPGRSISYEFIAEHLRQLFGRMNIKKVAFDRWNFKHLQSWLAKVGLGENFIKDHFVEFGQGWASMSPALLQLEQLLRERLINHGDNPILKMCVSNAIVVKDDAGNRKLSKKKSVGRIDGIVALTMACGIAPLQGPAIDVEALIGILLISVCSVALIGYFDMFRSCCQSLI